MIYFIIFFKYIISLLYIGIISARLGGADSGTVAAGTLQAGRGRVVLAFWPGGVRRTEVGPWRKRGRGRGAVRALGGCRRWVRVLWSKRLLSRCSPELARSWRGSPGRGGVGLAGPRALPGLSLVLGSSGSFPGGLPQNPACLSPCFL